MTVTAEIMSLVTYNGKHIYPQQEKPNIFLGVGLWSKKHGLSEGLPIDVIKMLVAAAITRVKILETCKIESSRIILLIADSMAINEGALEEEVSKVVDIYKKSLNSLLESLNLAKSVEIVLSSKLEGKRDYQEIIASVKDSENAKQLQVEDSDHHGYVCAQTALTIYMNRFNNVGVKVGWSYAASSKNHWDEPMFDRFVNKICPGIQYLYTAAGLRMQGEDRNINVIEGCPYTAYTGDRRYIMQTAGEIDTSTIITKLPKALQRHWRGVIKACGFLIQNTHAQSTLLPPRLIQRNNENITIQNIFNYWVNLPFRYLKGSIGSEESQTGGGGAK